MLIRPELASNSSGPTIRTSRASPASSSSATKAPKYTRSGSSGGWVTTTSSSRRFERKRSRLSISRSFFLPKMYSAFSERSPSAAASETSRVTRGRSTFHSRSSSAASRS
jgi:hypothetical protein